jgi:hypothetical protein
MLEFNPKVTIDVGLTNQYQWYVKDLWKCGRLIIFINNEASRGFKWE